MSESPKVEPPKVSVAIITYNHEKYIQQAVESVFAQETPFSVELIIGDDASTDKTQDRLIKLRAISPRNTTLVLRETNIGAAKNLVDVISRCRGQYIALLEGDDYWCCPTKLAEQALMLDRNPAHAMSFHRAAFLHGSTGLFDVSTYGPSAARAIYTTDDLISEGNFIPTASIMFRRSAVDQASLSGWYLRCPIGDLPLNLIVSLTGPLGYIARTLSVYRVTGSGSYSGRSQVGRISALVESYQIAASNLGLTTRPVFAHAMVNLHVQLARLHRADRRYLSALASAWSAIRFAPWREVPRRLAWLIARSSRIFR